ncbi:MAG: hypothetical protein N3A69_04520 [Leptospiraceae bacterium]|nr:hypothetical protein [Leptospiraceae bacterium]
MENLESIRIEIRGKNETDITPENFDIREIVKFFGIIEDLLFPQNKRNRPSISFSIEKGSVKLNFQTRAEAVKELNQNLKQVQEKQSLSNLLPRFQKALEDLQKYTYEKESRIQLQTSVEEKFIFKIDEQTNYKRISNLWFDSEIYLYGKIILAGGKDKTHVQIQTEKGTFDIRTTSDFFQNLKENIIHINYGVRVKAKQNIDTGDIDPKSLQLIELVKYNPTLDEEYLKSLREKAQLWLNQIDLETWLKEIRGYEPTKFSAY